jgi:hypothetical protein
MNKDFLTLTLKWIVISCTFITFSSLQFYIINFFGRYFEMNIEFCREKILIAMKYEATMP